MNPIDQIAAEAALIAAIESIELIKGDGRFRLVRDSEVQSIIQPHIQSAIEEGIEAWLAGKNIYKIKAGWVEKLETPIR